jgi:hypothetical protein
MSELPRWGRRVVEVVVNTVVEAIVAVELS